ncbi:hypothetical protein ACFCXH_00200 [Streptomyces nojiriensis]|uniref:hypothetical protein n=1 Tax=Streptomyces nojiriensis TaxID=66374 RepID=UPI0035DA062A
MQKSVPAISGLFVAALLVSGMAAELVPHGTSSEAGVHASVTAGSADAEVPANPHDGFSWG